MWDNSFLWLWSCCIEESEYFWFNSRWQIQAASAGIQQVLSFFHDIEWGVPIGITIQNSTVRIAAAMILQAYLTIMNYISGEQQKSYSCFTSCLCSKHYKYNSTLLSQLEISTGEYRPAARYKEALLHFGCHFYRLLEDTCRERRRDWEAS